MTPPPSRAEAANGLREQAASCRRLATQARTQPGSTALNALADHYDSYASRLDPNREPR